MASRPSAKADGVCGWSVAQVVRVNPRDTSRRETAISTAMVLVMVVVASIFFLVADQVMSFGVSYLLGIGS